MMRRDPDQKGVEVLLGAAVIVFAMTFLIMMAGSFGHTRRMNADLSAPQLAAPAAPGFR